MKISEATMGVLRNFSDINNNILFKPGKSIATMSTSRMRCCNARSKLWKEPMIVFYAQAES